MPTVLDTAVEAEYLALVRAFPLVSIRDDEHLEEALLVIERLLNTQRSKAEDAYLGALLDLVEKYEDAHVDIPPLTGVDAVRYLMEANGLSQADLVPLFGTASVVSEVLAGKRRLALSHIQKLAEYFGLPADVFMPKILATAVPPDGSDFSDFLHNAFSDRSGLPLPSFQPDTPGASRPGARRRADLRPATPPRPRDTP